MCATGWPFFLTPRWRCWRHGFAIPYETQPARGEILTRGHAFCEDSSRSPHAFSVLTICVDLAWFLSTTWRWTDCSVTWDNLLRRECERLRTRLMLSVSASRAVVVAVTSVCFLFRRTVRCGGGPVAAGDERLPGRCVPCNRHSGR